MIAHSRSFAPARPVLAALALFAACGVFAADTNGPAGSVVPVYSLNDCIAIGLAKATRISGAKHDQEIAADRIRQSRSEVFPNLALHAGYTRLDAVSSFNMGGVSIPMSRLDNYSSSATIDQLIYSGGRVGAALRASKLYSEYANQGLDIAQQGLKKDIRLAFNDILLAKAAVETGEQSIRHIRDAAEDVERKYKSGTASEFDWLTVKVRLANEQPAMIGANNGLAVAKEAFRNLVHLGDGEFDLQGTLEFQPAPFDLDALGRSAIDRRPEMLQMRTQLSLLEQDVIASRGKYYPDFRAFGTYAGTDPDQSKIGSTQWGWHWTAGLTASWTLFDGGLTPSVVSQKKIALEKMRDQYADMKLGVLLEIKQAALDVGQAVEKVQGGTESVALAEKALNIAKTRFEQGLCTFLEFNDANLALSTARLARWTALRDYNNALCRLRYASGTME